MPDVKLFKLHPSGRAVELPGEAVSIERSLQTLIERGSEMFLDMKFLASECSTVETSVVAHSECSVGKGCSSRLCAAVGGSDEALIIRMSEFRPKKRKLTVGRGEAISRVPAVPIRVRVR